MLFVTGRVDRFRICKVFGVRGRIQVAIAIVALQK
jgi:hypothetical protein